MAVNAIEERRLAASLRLLAAASRELSTSFDYAQTLAAVGRLIVPAFAEGFTVEVDEGEILTTLVETGRLDRETRAMPLVARNRTVGVMRVAGARHEDASAEIDIWDELALRIAVAIDAAQIYAREHHVADTLQRALLPERLPQDDRLAFDAAYLPGVQEAIVGGDWYDAFRLPDGRIAFSVGDVAGHGLRAAIVMGEVRQAFRAAALNPNSPSLVLERANTIVNMRANPVMVTAVFGIVDPEDGVFTYASAGHPAPVIALPDGSAQFLPKDGLPLGIVDSVEAHDWTFTLPPGARLTLYTDGLIEYTRNVVEGERRLIEAIVAGLIEDEESNADKLLARVFADHGNTDDVATLSISAPDSAPPAFTFTFSAVPVAVPLLRRSLQRYAARLGLGEDQTFALVTSVGEAVANAVEHAYGGEPGRVHVHGAPSPDGMIAISVVDEGKWKPAQRRDERGRGLPLMRALSHAVEIRTHAMQTEVRLKIAR